MHRLFQKLCTEVFGLPRSVADQLYKDKRRPASGPHRLRGRRAQPTPRYGVRVDYSDVDEMDEDDGDLVAPSPPSRADVLRRRANGPIALDRMHVMRRKPLRGSAARPLAAHLRCRGALHDPVAAPHLAPLNTPLYIATDSRHPTSDPNLAPFFRWFPCAFLLADFSSTGEANEVNDKPIAELVRLAGADAPESTDGTTFNQWISDWDGTGLGRFLLPFLEAEASLPYLFFFFLALPVSS